MKNKKLLKLSIMAAAFGLGATAVVADGHKERFKEADTNGDGAVSHAEMMARVQAKFAEFDKNADGFIVLDELPKEMPMNEKRAKKLEKKKEKMEKRLKEKGVEDTDAFMKKMHERKPTRMKFMARHDHDGDERLSVEEFGSKMIHMFKRMDLNGDGTVTMEEAKEAKGKFMKRRHKKHKRKHQG